MRIRTQISSVVIALQVRIRIYSIPWSLKREGFFRKSTNISFYMVTNLFIYTTGSSHSIDDCSRAVCFLSIFNRFVGVLICEGPPSCPFACEKWNVLAFSLLCNRKSTIILSNLEKYIKKQMTSFNSFRRVLFELFRNKNYMSVVIIG